MFYSVLQICVSPVVYGLLEGVKMRANFSQSTPTEMISLKDLKCDIENNIGKTITIYELNRNSKKVVNEYKGKIVGVYANLFSISLTLNNKTQIEKCFNYSGFQVGLLKYKLGETEG